MADRILNTSGDPGATSPEVMENNFMTVEFFDYMDLELENIRADVRESSRIVTFYEADFTCPLSEKEEPVDSKDFIEFETHDSEVSSSAQDVMDMPHRVYVIVGPEA
jgi:hypothetical protein